MSKIRNVLSCIFLFLLTALILNLANPLFDKPSRDGGFFLYAGQQILNGKIPYLDFWDSKGPAIFYINALGLWLGGGSRWGVWAVEFLCIFGFHAFFLHWLTALRSLAPRPEAHRQGAARGSDLQRAPRDTPGEAAL